MRIQPYINPLLFRTTPSLFTYKKEGIILKYKMEDINLSNLFKIDRGLVWYYLDNLIEQDLPEWLLDEVREVMEEFIKENLKNN